MSRILIADDSRVQLHLLSSFLVEKGFAILTAVDSLQAWTTAIRERPDLIVLDINMPAGSGVEVLRKLKMSTKTMNIPVIVLTADTDAETERKARNMGAAEFLKKPVQLEELHESISRLLSKKESPPRQA